MHTYYIFLDKFVSNERLTTDGKLLEFLSQNATLLEISCHGLNQLSSDDKIYIKCKKPKELSIKMCTASKLVIFIMI